MATLDGSQFPDAYLGGGFNYFLFSPLSGEDSVFDYYFSDGLKPPTRYIIIYIYIIFILVYVYYILLSGGRMVTVPPQPGMSPFKSR